MKITTFFHWNRSNKNSIFNRCFDVRFSLLQIILMKWKSEKNEQTILMIRRMILSTKLLSLLNVMNEQEKKNERVLIISSTNKIDSHKKKQEKFRSTNGCVCVLDKFIR